MANESADTSLRELRIQPQANRPMIVGFGSYHGRDQTGWLVASLAKSLLGDNVEVYQAQVPHALLDWLPHPGPLHLVDAEIATDQLLRRFRIDASSGTMMLSGVCSAERMQWDQINPCRYVNAQLCSSSSHQLALPEVLELAATLGLLPESSELWTIGIVESSEVGSANENLGTLTQQCGTLLAAELSHA